MVRLFTTGMMEANQIQVDMEGMQNSRKVFNQAKCCMCVLVVVEGLGVEDMVGAVPEVSLPTIA